MFGHQDDHKDHHDQPAADNLIPTPTIDGILSSDAHPTGGTAVVSDTPADSTDDSFNPALPPADNQPGAQVEPEDQPELTLPTPPKEDEEDDVPAASAPTFDEPADVPARGASTDDQPADTNGLLDIKQQALTQLTPLVGHLDQSPEEKFRTTMMMIQAADNQSLIQTAYEAAQAIPDEKAKAQALLDIVNEINYFTQSKN